MTGFVHLTGGSLQKKKPEENIPSRFCNEPHTNIFTWKTSC
jgi:hypothetical protein